MPLNQKKKIKVLRIISRLNIGGPSIHVVLLTAGLNRDKFETLLLSGVISPAEGDMSYYAASKRVKPLYISQLKRDTSLWGDITAIFKIYKIIDREKPDIIHTHTAKAGTLGRLAGLIYNIFHPFRKKIRLIHTFHGHVFSGYFNPLKSGLFVFIERCLANVTDLLITVSGAVKAELLAFKISKPDKIRVINLGFELDEFLKIPYRKGGAVNIGIVGRLTAVKNHLLFLEAAKELLKSQARADLKFRVVGDGELRNDLEAVSRDLGLSDAVEFIGWRKEIEKVYEDLNIVALTSLNEGTPVSLIEAMASGRPVVAADVGGVRDLLGERLGGDSEFDICKCGILVKVRDPASFSRALSMLIDDGELRRSIGAAAREFAAATFNQQRLCRDIEDLYFEQLGRRAQDKKSA